MFPIIAIESAYQEHLSADWRPSGAEFLQIGSLCEQWLLTSAGIHPTELATNDVCSKSSNNHVDRMYFSMAMALCSPSQHTVELIDRYHQYIHANGFDIGNHVIRFSKLTEDKCPLDLMLIFRGLPHWLYDVAATVYRISINQLATNAVAWDDLVVFKKCYDRRSSQTWADRFAPLMDFPVDPSTKIHKFLMQSPTADQDFLHILLLNLRVEITDEYIEGALYNRCIVDQKFTLMPGGLVWLDWTNSDKTFYNEPWFAERLMVDPERHIQAFFEPLGEQRIIDANIVDEVTQAFLDAGVPPSLILTQASGKSILGSTKDSLKNSLIALRRMSEHDRSFFRKAYSVYLKDFTPTEILSQCTDIGTAKIVYQITHDNRLLQAGNEQFRDAIIGADLGL